MKKYYYNSPIGTIEITGSENGIASLYFVETENVYTDCPECLAKCVKQIDEYFNKKRKIFDLKFDLQGTDFQKRVWTELLKIPYGKTCSYLDIAKAIGNKLSIRAVGNANGKNPVSIIIPCHRVIGSDGNLVGYGGGLWRKKWLLDFENKSQTELFDSI
ncbi:MAG TPA: methylated-DNA--[protein]-cysteine S-methyltransferase [Bacteroidales bacterium]|nr:methylated-DNA--[protein]-cysteine S-methyltransferase [Bacteroidales bacterium]HPS16248.1 methylated-DNA--[protein]-cysteine S-methyltransferase [Bacteroidales bacterium]